MDISEKKDIQGANLEGAYLVGTNLKGAQHLSLFQLSKMKTLHDTKLDEEPPHTIKKEVSCPLKKPLNRKSSRRSP